MVIAKVRMWLRQLNTYQQSTTTCIICQNQVSSSLNNLLSSNNQICNICFNKMEPNIKTLRIAGINGKTLIKYNEFTKNLILQIKAKYDLALAKVILAPFRHLLKQNYKGYHVAHVPSSAKSDKIRGFNHVKAMFQLLDLPHLEVFEKTSNYKQAKQSLSQRENISKAITLKSNVILPSKILIVDDIITSGASVATCLELLKQQDVKHLAFLVFAENCRNIRQKRHQIKTK